MTDIAMAGRIFHKAQRLSKWTRVDSYNPVATQWFRLAMKWAKKHDNLELYFELRNLGHV